MLFRVLALNLWKSMVGAQPPTRCSNVGSSVVNEDNLSLSRLHASLVDPTAVVPQDTFYLDD